jgi:hypothetical protein
MFMQENLLLDLKNILTNTMQKYCFKGVDTHLLLLLTELSKEAIKYWRMLELLKCMENKENICLDYNNQHYMGQIHFILTQV